MDLMFGRLVRYRLKRADLTTLHQELGGTLVLDENNSPTHLNFIEGNTVVAGQVFPMMVTNVEDGFIVNGTVFISGTQTLRVISANRGDDPGCWFWPTPTFQSP